MNKYKVDIRLARSVVSCFVKANTEEEAIELAVSNCNISKFYLPINIKNWTKVVKL